MIKASRAGKMQKDKVASLRDGLVEQNADGTNPVDGRDQAAHGAADLHVDEIAPHQLIFRGLATSDELLDFSSSRTSRAASRSARRAADDQKLRELLAKQVVFVANRWVQVTLRKR